MDVGMPLKASVVVALKGGASGRPDGACTKCAYACVGLNGKAAAGECAYGEDVGAYTRGGGGGGGAGARGGGPETSIAAAAGSENDAC